MPLTVGDRLGHYDVTGLIGKGGIGFLDTAQILRKDGHTS